MRRNLPQPPAPPKLFGVLFSIIPMGIGLTVLIFLWSKPFDEWDSPPLIFRVFGSFIALGFLLFGGLAIRTFSAGAKGLSSVDVVDRAIGQSAPGTRPPAAPGRYACPDCGAALDPKAEVSPLGDVKCGYCGSWFNIHGRSA